MTTIIAFHNTKGGVGTTLLAAHACALAREHGLRVTALAFDSTQDLSKWLRPLGIACADGLPSEELPDDIDLIVIDVSTGAPSIPLDPDLWVIPIDCGFSIDCAFALSDRLTGRVLWLENRAHGHTSRSITLPRFLEGVQVRTGPSGVPRSRALWLAGNERSIVWADDEGACSAGACRLRAALTDVLIQAGALPAPPTLATKRADASAA